MPENSANPNPITSPPIRVSFCHYSSDIVGGSDGALRDLITRLPKARIAPAMILKTGDPMADYYRDLGIPVEEITFVPPRRALHPIKLLKFFAAFLPNILSVARALKKQRAQVVHVNTAFNLQGPFAAKLLRLPLAWHLRELIPDSRVMNTILWLMPKLADRIPTISQCVSDTLPPGTPQITLVYDGIDVETFDTKPTPEDITALRQELDLPQDAPLVVTIGRIEPWKGQHILAQAIPAIIDAHPDAHILFVGAAAVNKPEYLAGIKALCDERNLNDHVHFTGIRKDIPRVLAAADILVLPTATPEPFGLTVPEAMAATTPVVATAHGGPRETVLDHETGLLVTPNDPTAMAKAINTILSDKNLATRMGTQGRERARTHFTIDRVAQQMTQMFEELHAARYSKRD